MAAALLTACTSASDKAKKRYEFLKEQHASFGEVCGAAKEWIRAASDTGDAAKYQDAQIEGGGACLDAQLYGSEQRYGLPRVEADNMDIAATPPAPVGRVDDAQEVPVCDRPDSASKRALMKKIGTDCLGE